MATGVGGGAQGRVAPTRAPRDVPAAGGAEEGVDGAGGGRSLGRRDGDERWRRLLGVAVFVGVVIIQTSSL
uniref:H0403D02.2 protein n=1 Tax=Oryza sativa TaxID=4530 RepID=Q259T2_ORYSA|nr:H0403D02.2 [Oryza sativa]